MVVPVPAALASLRVDLQASDPAAVESCNTDGNTDIGIILKIIIEIVHHNRCYNSLACPRNARAEQCLFAQVEPFLEFIRIQQPLPSPFLSSADVVTLLRGIVNRSKTIDNGLMLLTTLLIILAHVQPIHPVFRR